MTMTFGIQANRQSGEEYFYSGIAPLLFSIYQIPVSSGSIIEKSVAEFLHYFIQPQRKTGIQSLLICYLGVDNTSLKRCS